MQAGAVHGAGREPHDGVGRSLSCAIRDIVEADVADGVQYDDGLHVWVPTPRLPRQTCQRRRRSQVATDCVATGQTAGWLADGQPQQRSAPTCDEKSPVIAQVSAIMLREAYRGAGIAAVRNHSRQGEAWG